MGWPRKYPVGFCSTGPLNPLYDVWRKMHYRCTPNAHFGGRPYSPRYFARGISVCEEWNDWPTFAQWALASGWRRGLEIDRRDNDRGYSPDNCRFVTEKEQARNRDLAHAARATQLGHIRRWRKPFECIETGEVFETQIEAHRKYGVDRKSLRHALNGKAKIAGGLRWTYLEASL